jgi:hypothetical protein
MRARVAGRGGDSEACNKEEAVGSTADCAGAPDSPGAATDPEGAVGGCTSEGDDRCEAGVEDPARGESVGNGDADVSWGADPGADAGTDCAGSLAGGSAWGSTLSPMKRHMR